MVERTDNWASGDAYEPYVGRWSRVVARELLRWLDVPANASWLDVGCGTGALSQTILSTASPSAVTGIDRSEEFVAYARAQLRDPRARFEVGDAQALPVESSTYDVAVSGLVLNFIPEPALAVAEMARATRGVVAVYVWDYAEKMEFMRHFWDAAAALDARAAELDEGRRFPICQAEPLRELFVGAGLRDVAVRAIDIDTTFRDFDDYWAPFLGGQGPAPTYVQSLNDAEKERLREQLRATLPFAHDGSIPMVARAWAVRGVSGSDT